MQEGCPDKDLVVSKRFFKKFCSTADWPRSWWYAQALPAEIAVPSIAMYSPVISATGLCVTAARGALPTLMSSPLRLGLCLWGWHCTGTVPLFWKYEVGNRARAQLAAATRRSSAPSRAGGPVVVWGEKEAGRAVVCSAGRRELSPPPGAGASTTTVGKAQVSHGHGVGVAVSPLRSAGGWEPVPWALWLLAMPPSSKAEAGPMACSRIKILPGTGSAACVVPSAGS